MLRGSKIGQKTWGRLTKIVPARQTDLGEFFGQTFGENTFLENAPKQQIGVFNEKSVMLGLFIVYAQTPFAKYSSPHAYGATSLR